MEDLPHILELLILN